MKKQTKKSARVSRPSPERRGPIRSWSTLLGGNDEAKKRAAVRTRGHEPQPDESPAEHGVKVGYQVADEYLRASDSSRSAWTAFGQGAAVRDPQQLAGRLLQYAADLSTGWLDLMGTLMMNGGMPPPVAGKPPGGFAATAEPSVPARKADEHEPTAAAGSTLTELAIRVKSARSVEVSASVDAAGMDGSSLTVHALRSKAGKQRISGVKLERAADGGLTLSIEIPANLPSGLYSGVIVDTVLSVPRGSVKVSV